MEDSAMRLLEPRLMPIDDGPYFRVILEVTASAVKRIRGKRTYELRNRFFHRVLHIGDINKDKLITMAKSKAAETTEDETFNLLDEPAVVDHPFGDLAYCEQSISFRLPNVIPQDYAMCEIGLRVGYITSRTDIEGESKALLNRIGPIVMRQLDELASECGGVPLFTKQEEEHAEAEANKEG